MEYKVVNLGESERSIEDALNSWSQAGWVLVEILPAKMAGIGKRNRASAIFVRAVAA